MPFSFSELSQFGRKIIWSWMNWQWPVTDSCTWNTLQVPTCTIFLAKWAKFPFKNVMLFFPLQSPVSPLSYPSLATKRYYNLEELLLSANLLYPQTLVSFPATQG